jgi:hypothetical protein
VYFASLRLLARNGNEYEYTVQVTNDVLSPLDIEGAEYFEGVSALSVLYDNF